MAGSMVYVWTQERMLNVLSQTEFLGLKRSMIWSYTDLQVAVPLVLMRRQDRMPDVQRPESICWTHVHPILTIFDLVEAMCNCSQLLVRLLNHVWDWENMVTKKAKPVTCACTWAWQIDLNIHVWFLQTSSDRIWSYTDLLVACSVIYMGRQLRMLDVWSYTDYIGQYGGMVLSNTDLQVAGMWFG